MPSRPSKYAARPRATVPLNLTFVVQIAAIRTWDLPIYYTNERRSSHPCASQREERTGQIGIINRSTQANLQSSFCYFHFAIPSQNMNFTSVSGVAYRQGGP